MSVLTRLLGWLLLGGLVVGVVLRLALGRCRFGPLVAGLVLVPALFHVAYVVIQALGHGASALGTLVYVVGSALVVAAAWVAGRRWTLRHPLWAALSPAATAAAYGLVPFALYSWALRQASIDLDIVPTAAYVGACLFGTALLLPFVPGGPGTARGWLDRFRRRR